MKLGDRVIIKRAFGLKSEGIIVDDCFRQTPERCTMLVKLVDNPDTELEINVEDVTPYGQDVQG